MCASWLMGNNSLQGMQFSWELSTPLSPSALPTPLNVYLIPCDLFLQAYIRCQMGSTLKLEMLNTHGLGNLVGDQVIGAGEVHLDTAFVARLVASTQEEWFALESHSKPAGKVPTSCHCATPYASHRQSNPSHTPQNLG